MPVNGPYNFKRAAKADAQGFVQEAIEIQDGEWGWYRCGDFLGLFLGCPDCHSAMTVWRRYLKDIHGHELDAAGNLSPSVLHTWPVNGVEQCGFHSIPTKLHDFVDAR